MLLTIQFPIADARKFLDQAERLGSPGWPIPDPNSEFVRYFGAIRDRHLGGLAGWLGEDRICKADRALIFSTQNRLFKKGPTNTRVVFRRFYFDGWAVGKFEVGFRVSQDLFPKQFDLLGKYFLHLPVRIGNPLGSHTSCELAQAGKPLAQLFHLASSPTKRTPQDQDAWQVRAGIPILLLEVRDRENTRIPNDARLITLPDWPPTDLRLFHHGIPYRGGKINIWILQITNPYWDKDVARNLRLYLLRLNAEHECLRLVLQSIANREIEITRGTPASDNLQWYLDKAMKRITHYESKTGQMNEEIAEIARQSINRIRPGQLDLLLERVEDYRKHLRKNIETFAIKDAQTVNINYMDVQKMENKQGNTYNFSNFQAGILNIESTMKNVTQNVGNVSNMDPASRDALGNWSNSLILPCRKPRKIE